jgi:hypothetical protein
MYCLERDAGVGLLEARIGSGNGCLWDAGTYAGAVGKWAHESGCHWTQHSPQFFGKLSLGCCEVGKEDCCPYRNHHQPD